MQLYKKTIYAFSLVFPLVKNYFAFYIITRSLMHIFLSVNSTRIHLRLSKFIRFVKIFLSKVHQWSSNLFSIISFQSLNSQIINLDSRFLFIHFSLRSGLRTGPNMSRLMYTDVACRYSRTHMSPFPSSPLYVACKHRLLEYIGSNQVLYLLVQP